ncbi:MAG: tetratricopeptide repeat protein, partial [Bacteroidales bacterium]|nr:tetratricopeptide repeat protein [Bacteroidales bacterium]
MKHFIKWVLLLTSLSLVTTIPAHALDLDSLYTVFSNSRGEKRVQAANEILEFAYENEYILTLYTLTNSDDQAFVNATVHSALGSYHLWEKGDYKRSTEFLVLALEYYEKNRDATEVNSLNGNIGNNYARIGDYENAVTYLLKCYEWEKGEGDNEALSSTLNSLGVVYSQWQKPDIAIRYFEEAVQIERPLNRPLQYATRLASLAKEYTFVDVSKSLPLIKEAMQYNEKIEPPNLRESRIAVHNILMGDVYYALDSLGQAANCYQKALTFFEKTGHPFHIATTLQALGRTQVTQHKFPEAVTTLRRSLEIAERNKLLNVQLYSSLYLSEAYSFIESKPLSHFYLKEYTLFKDSLFRQTTQQQLNDFQVKYETAEKQLEIERQQTEIERHQTRQFILVGGLIAAGLLLGLLVYNIRLRARRNR